MGALSAKSAYLGWLAGAFTKSGTVFRDAAGGSTDLVLGYATGYDSHDIGPFVRSLRAVFDGRIALVVDQRPDVLALLAENDAEALAPATTEGWAPHAVMARFAAFDRYLAEHADVRNVLITDVRDVIFQKPPFQPEPEGLEVFVESDALGDHDFNMKYLRALAGDSIAEALAGAPSICVGTVMGPRREVARLCRMILMLAAVPRSALGGAFGADQAACNIAVHTGLIEARICANYGRIATIGLTPSDQVSVVNGDIVNPDGSVSAIVHQHDRHPALAMATHQRWGAGLEVRERVRPKDSAARSKKRLESIQRRLPELR